MSRFTGQEGKHFSSPLSSHLKSDLLVYIYVCVYVQYLGICQPTYHPYYVYINCSMYNICTYVYGSSIFLPIMCVYIYKM